ncbi:TauD/TfdA family dioxygenase [Pigmentiphaga soli]|uniref:TauD/TfdA family dioxygenase n=1 Tax=Pigmentiphaga soli TaxID=1007095 RepID=A0ABP8GLX2_9BURK
MTPVYRQIIDHPSAWTRRSLGGDGPLRRRLTAAELDGVDRLLDATAHLAPQQATRADFDHPAVNALMAGLRDEIMHGRGAVIVEGLDPGRYDAERLERIYWGLGTHLGIGAAQSARGDRLGYVQNQADDEVKRGYRSLRELHMHTDSYELVGLMCVRKAKSGGLSGLVSGLALHNEILRTRPELLEPLYRGYRYASDEARFSSKAITDEAIPAFCAVDGVVSCCYEPAHMKNAAQYLGEPLPADLAQACDYFDELSMRDDLALRLQLQPGEFMLWHNYICLHSRTAFEDDPQQRRLLLRLWLSVPDGRPVDPAFRIRAETYERIYREARARAA